MIKNVLIPFLIVFLLLSCDSEDEKKGQTDNFDRGAMLTNWADNIIIPSFENFSTATGELKGSADIFLSNPTVENLSTLRTAFENAYIQYQTVAPFQIGKAETIDYHNFLNIYPTDVPGIQEKIASGTYNLELPSSFDQQGFPAVDYLINGLAGTDAEVVEFYTSGPEATAYSNYLRDVITRIDSLTTTILEDWKGPFRDTFVSNTSSSSTGSVDRFTNDYIMYYEMDLRSGKIGIPAGVFTGNPVPETAEAFYSEGLSRQLYLRALETMQEFFNGNHFGSNQTGPSYRQYLDYLYSIRGGDDLGAMIDDQFEVIQQQASQLNPDLAEQVRLNNDLMLAAYDQLQKNVVLLKIDLMQALDISVDYVDTDGD